MKRTLEERRLKAIKLRRVLFSKECDCCKSLVRGEKMWNVYTWGINKSVHKKFFCLDCMKSTHDVLEKVKSSTFGIAFVDEF